MPIIMLYLVLVKRKNTRYGQFIRLVTILITKYSVSFILVSKGFKALFLFSFLKYARYIRHFDFRKFRIPLHPAKIHIEARYKLWYNFSGMIHSKGGTLRMSRADEIFIQNCREILSDGIWDTDREVRPRWEDGSPAHTVKKFGIVNRYDLSQEFPILTIRRTFWKSAIDELLWIWQAKSNNVHDLRTRVWDAWADETGSIGKAYGYQLGVKHHYPEGDMDQVDKVLWDLKHTPASRRIMTNIYNFADLSEMALYPCAYSMTFNVSGHRLNAILNQRSQDMLAANNWNVVQYAVLTMMMAQVSDLEPGELIHVIADAHIYDRHVPAIEEIIQNPPKPAPRFSLDPDVKDFYAFTRDSFRMEGYEYSDFTGKIPVAV